MPGGWTDLQGSWEHMHRREEREIHPHLASLLCVAGVVTGVSVFAFTGASCSFVIDGRLVSPLVHSITERPKSNYCYQAYISEGFEAYCGWASSILGSAGGITMLAQLVVAEHINSTWAVAATLTQFLAWNIILGVADTGWTLHYVALGLFFGAAVCFHRLASTTPPYATLAYQRVNGVTLVLLAAFCALFCAAAAAPTHRREIITATVTLEYTIALLTVAQMTCLAYGLALFCKLTLVFETNKEAFISCSFWSAGVVRPAPRRRPWCRSSSGTAPRR